MLTAYVNWLANCEVNSDQFEQNKGCENAVNSECKQKGFGKVMMVESDHFLIVLFCFIAIFVFMLQMRHKMHFSPLPLSYISVCATLIEFPQLYTIMYSTCSCLGIISSACFCSYSPAVPLISTVLYKTDQVIYVPGKHSYLTANYFYAKHSHLTCTLYCIL